MLHSSVLPSLFKNAALPYSCFCQFGPDYTRTIFTQPHSHTNLHFPMCQYASWFYNPHDLHKNKTLPEAQGTQGIACKLELSLQLMVAPLALVPNLATRWRHLHELKNWPQDGATCISCMSWKIGHQMASLALVPNLATRWHHLHELKNWPQDGATSISCMSWKIGHQMAPLALVPNLATRWHHLH